MSKEDRVPFYEKVVDLVKSQVGYHEGRSNGLWNNDQKYSKEVPGFGWSNRQSWCATMQSWVDWKLGLTKGAGDNVNSPCTASVREAYNWGLRKGRFTRYPVIGAWTIVNEDEHTERVIDFDDTYVWTVGGNTNDNGSSNGDGVYLKKHLRRGGHITGYVVPVFPDGAYKSPDPKWNTAGHAPKVVDVKTPAKPAAPLRTPAKISWASTQAGLKSGKPSGNVKILQHLLNISGWSRVALGEGHSLVEDGEWGPQSRKVYAAYQRKYSANNHKGWNSAQCDGNPGVETFRALVSWRHSYTPVA